MHEDNENKARIGPARNAARSLIKRCRIKEAPVSLGTIIRHLQRSYDLDVYSYSGFSEKMSGMLVTVENQETGSAHNEIHINADHHWRRRRFTIAHELGHLFLNTTCGSGVENYFDEGKPLEVEADVFAAELLMPLAFLNKDLVKNAMVEDLAWKYIVSKEAMGWKIAKSNLLRKL